MLNIYGVSQAGLKEFVTTDRDILRKIDRRPNDDFLLDVTGTQQKKIPARNDDEEFDLDAAADEFFDFVLIDMDDDFPDKKKKKEKEEPALAAKRKEKIQKE
jgi:hypothetical protein